MSKKSHCYAYYADGKFIGWYADTFGSVRTCPKLYSGDVEVQSAIVKQSFSGKIRTINKTSFEEAKGLPEYQGLGAIALARFDSEEKLRGKQIELRVVECPIYDGPDPDFSKEIMDALRETQKEQMKKFFKQFGRDYDNFPASKERVELVDRFHRMYGDLKCNNWIYADYEQVREWAKDEPTEFVAIVTPEIESNGK